VINLLRLDLKPGESLDKALRRFKKLCNREGLTRDMRRLTAFEKPSEANKRIKREQERARAKLLRQGDKRKVKARKARVKSLKAARVTKQQSA
jgi:small subunit ribosomal protein S21